MVRGTSSPASTSGGIGHHSDSEWKPTSLGRSVKIQPCSLLTSARKKYAAAEMGTPDDRSQHQQSQVALGPQQRKRIRWRRHHSPLNLGRTAHPQSTRGAPTIGLLLGGSFPGLGSVVQKFGLCRHAGQVHSWLPVSTVEYRG